MSPRHVVVSGASRGLGEALARSYSAPGMRLSLVGRDRDRLGAVAAACRMAGAEVEEIRLDVCDREALAERLRRVDDTTPIDLVVANAGVALPTAEPNSPYGEIEVNLVGALNTVLPLVPRMTARGSGQIALMSSLAAFAPLPSSPGYSASKAALLVYGLALRERLRPDGVKVNVVCPGFIDTEMGARYRGWRPLPMSPADAAARVRRGLEADRAVIAFPRRLAVFARASQLVPEPVRRIGLKAFRFKVEEG